MMRIPTIARRTTTTIRTTASAQSLSFSFRSQSTFESVKNKQARRNMNTMTTTTKKKKKKETMMTMTMMVSSRRRRRRRNDSDSNASSTTMMQIGDDCDRCPVGGKKRSRRGSCDTRSSKTRAQSENESSSSLLDEIYDRCPVPMDQRPSSQLREVSEGFVSGWGGLDSRQYAIRISILCGFFFVFLAYPISSETYNPEIQWTEAHVAAMLGSLVAVSAVCLNIHNSWVYVRNRLLSATIEYEETGWYDGQVFVKTPEMLAKDRLDGMYVCGPAVARCKNTLLACGAGVLACVFALNTLDAPKIDRENFGTYTPEKAALLRDIGLGSYLTETGESKRISQGDEFSQATADAYEGDNDDDDDEEVNGVVMSYAPR
jgi:hypothetical protein